jgi:hypothetical protein
VQVFDEINKMVTYNSCKSGFPAFWRRPDICGIIMD